MKLTRQQLLAGGAAGAALGAAGIYELVDQLAESPPRHFGEGRGPEQHLLDGMHIKDVDGVEVVVPTRHHQMVTAKVVASETDLRDAQTSLEEVLARLDDRFPGTPDGLGDHRRLGPAVLPAPRGGRGRAPPSDRPPRVDEVERRSAL